MGYPCGVRNPGAENGGPPMSHKKPATHFVQAEKDHVPRLLDIMVACYGIDRREAREELRCAKAAGGLPMVMTLEGHVVGFVICFLGAYCEVEWGGVCPHYKGRGFGRRLVRHVERASRETGKAKVVVYTGDGQLPAHKLLRSEGYVAAMVGGTRADAECHYVFRLTLAEKIDDGRN